MPARLSYRKNVTACDQGNVKLAGCAVGQLFRVIAFKSAVCQADHLFRAGANGGIYATKPHYLW
jgi:hypothetical protein